MDDSEMWREHRKEGQARRAKNHESSIQYLIDKRIPFKILNESIGHYRVGDFDFWPSTGKFYNQKTKKKGRGIFNLIKLLK